MAKTPPKNLPPSTPPKTQDYVLKKLPGTTKDKCVNVGDEQDVTSGSLAMGNFQTARAQYAQLETQSEQPTVNVYVIPKHRAMPGVRIVMTPVTAKGTVKTVTSKDVQPADVWKYYSVHMPVPAPGTWRLDVRSGSDSGCFKVDFSK